MAYGVIAKYIGFGPPMLVFIPIFMWVNNFRRPGWIILITLATAAGLTLLFGTVAVVPIWDLKKLY